MSVLDPLQRYLRLDEKEDSKVVKVANGVTFIATANVGNEYTATRVMDRALLNRFPVIIEMNPLNKEDELRLVKQYIDVNNEEQMKTLESIVDIAAKTREQVKLEDGKLTNFLSTRAVVEMAELISDGFNLLEIAEMNIYPNFSSDGGADAERVFMRQLLQKYLPSDTTLPKDSPF